MMSIGDIFKTVPDEPDIPDLSVPTNRKIRSIRVNEDDAPDGYIAVEWDKFGAACLGCDFITVCMDKKIEYPCFPDEREDHMNVYFVQNTKHVATSG